MPIGHIEGDDGERHPVTVADYDALAEQLAGAVADYNAVREQLRGAVDALLAAPMPERESIHKGEEWAERYGEWWHEHVRPHIIGGSSTMSLIERDRVQKARDALDVALRSRDQSPRLYRGAMRAAMEDLDAALATDRGAVVRADAAEKAVTLAHHWLNEGNVEQAMRALEDVLHPAGGQ